MNELQVFNFKENEIRSLIIENEPWFVGKEIATILGYADTKDAVKRHVDEDDKQIIQRGQITALEIPNRGLTIINESGLYSLILSSKLPQAKEFKKWVTKEVLPTIRKTGSYGMPQIPTDTRDILMLTIKAHEETAQRVDKLEEKVSELEVSTTINSSQQNTLNKTAKHTVINVLGGMDSPAYEKLSSKMFSRIWSDYRNYFKLGSYRDTLKTEFEKAKSYLESWTPEVNLQLKIKEVNSQMSMGL